MISGLSFVFSFFAENNHLLDGKVGEEEQDFNRELCPEFVPPPNIDQKVHAQDVATENTGGEQKIFSRFL